MNGELLIDWPESQTCMDCSHGQFVGIDDRPSCYLCHFDNNTDALVTVPLNCPIYRFQTTDNCTTGNREVQINCCSCGCQTVTELDEFCLELQHIWCNCGEKLILTPPVDDQSTDKGEQDGKRRKNR